MKKSHCGDREGEIRHIAILIPARNEEELLPRCLRSVQAARLQLPPDVTSDVVVVSDCSLDGTRRAAEAILGESGVVMEIEAGMVGTARALAAEIALKRYRGPRRRCWLANTDGGLRGSAGLAGEPAGDRASGGLPPWRASSMWTHFWNTTRAWRRCFAPAM